MDLPLHLQVKNAWMELLHALGAQQIDATDDYLEENVYLDRLPTVDVHALS